MSAAGRHRVRPWDGGKHGWRAICGEKKDAAPAHKPYYITERNNVKAK